MPVPSNVTGLDLSGKYFVDVPLCDREGTKKCLQILGLSGLEDAVLSKATAIDLRHYRDSLEIEHLDLFETLGDGSPGMDGPRILTWKEQKFDDPALGPLISKSRRVKIEELAVVLAKEDLESDALSAGVIEDLMESDSAKSGKNWTMKMTFRIQNTLSGRRLVWGGRFSGPKEAETVDVDFYFDYVGPL